MKIVILSTGPNLYSTNRLKEAALERGHEAEIINHTQCYVVIESGNPKVFFGDHSIDEVDAIIPRIGASVSFYGSSIVRQFEMQKVFTTTSSLALARSRDKLRATQILSRHGIGIPKTAFAKKPNDIKNLINDIRILRPTIFGSFPAFFNKIHQKLRENVEARSNFV